MTNIAPTAVTPSVTKMVPTEVPATVTEMVPTEVVPTVTQIVPTEVPAPVVLETDAFTLYSANCSTCHGMAGKGSRFMPPLDNPDLRQADESYLYTTIAFGRDGTAMPAWAEEAGGTLTNAEIYQLIAFIRAGEWGQ